MTNSADPDQLASSEATWSGSTLFAKTVHVMFSKRRVKIIWNTAVHLNRFSHYYGKDEEFQLWKRVGLQEWTAHKKNKH